MQKFYSFFSKAAAASILLLTNSFVFSQNGLWFAVGTDTAKTNRQVAVTKNMKVNGLLSADSIKTKNGNLTVTDSVTIKTYTRIEDSVRVTGALRIGDSSITIQGGSFIAGTQDVIATNSGILNFLSTASVSTPGFTDIKIGIGADNTYFTPAERLDIVSSGADGAKINFRNGNTTTVTPQGTGSLIGISSQGHVQLFQLETNKHIFIGTNGGNTGIGTASTSFPFPTERLDVDGNARFRTIPVFSGITGTNQSIVITDNTTNTGTLNRIDFNGNATQFLSGNGTWATPAGGGGGTVTSSCATVNQVPKMGSSTNLICSQIFDDNTNVGIGTTNPGNFLSLNGNSANRTIWAERRTTALGGSRLTLQAGGAFSGGTDLAGGELRLSSGIATGTGSSFMSFYTATADGSGTSDNTPTEKIRILGSGNVGIGHTNPAQPLVVNGPVGHTLVITHAGNSVGDRSGLEFNWSSGNGNGTANVARIMANLQTGGGGDLLFETAPSSAGAYTTKMTLTRAGNMGIGTTTPAGPLHVKDREIAANGTDDDGDGFTDETNHLMVFTNAGRVGIGVAAPVNLFHVKDDETGANGTDDDGDGFIDEPTSMIYTRTGRLGIGLTNPAQPLVVNGPVGHTLVITHQGNSVGDRSGLEFNWASGNGNGTANVARIMANLQSSGGGDLLFETAPSSTGAYTTKMTLTRAGRVGIGLPAPAFQLELSQNSAGKPISSLWTVTSDIRVKKDTSSFTDGLNIINQIHPVNYRYNGKAGMTDTSTFGVGIIGQQIQSFAPYMIKSYSAKLDTSDSEETELLSFDGGPLLFITVNAIKELSLKDSLLNVKTEQQDSLIQSLQSQISECCANPAARKGNVDNALQQQYDSLNSEMQTLKEQMQNFEQALQQCCFRDVGQQTKNSKELIVKESNRLEQNIPNPFTQNTIIKYYLSENATSASIIIYDLQGKQIKKFENLPKGAGIVTIAGKELYSGMFMYTLIVDGKLVDSKTMLLTN